MSLPVLEMSGASVVMGGKTLLGPLTLTLADVPVVAVLGPNGAGKSLFLHLIHGLVAPSQGSVRWDGVPAVSGRGRRGFMFQATPVLRRSVLANAAFPLLAAGIGWRERRETAMQALEVAGLGGKAAQPAASLSGGELQKLALVRATVTGPGVVILDEPSASLDPESTAALEAQIRRISGAGTRVIFSSHDEDQARRLAGQAIWFRNGQIERTGSAV